MCVVSMIHDYSQRWVPPTQTTPTGPPVDWQGIFAPPPPKMDAEALALLKTILALCEKLDAKMGEPDCIDPNKAKVLAALEEYVASQNAPKEP